MIKTLLMSAALLAPTSLAAKDWQSFCKEVPVWPKGSEVPPDAEYKDLATPVDGKFAKEKWDAMKKRKGSMNARGPDSWVIVDARSAKDRSVGKVPKSALITADYNDASKNQFNDTFVTKKVNRLLKSKFPSVKDMKGVNFIVFCNGKKCHRSSFAACEMRRLGVQRDNLYIMTGGFPEWKDRGYPVR